jgi:hypothetical protein
MSEVQETAEEIRARWNPLPTNGGLARMISTAEETNTPSAGPTSSKVDAGLPPGLESLTPVGQEPVEDDYTDMSYQELKDTIDDRNDDRDEDDLISKGGSADDLRARLREDDVNSPPA